MSRLRGPLGVLTASVAAGVATGLVTAHVVLAVWTHRDARRRGVARRRTWTLAVLVGGVGAFVPYLLVRAAGQSLEGGPVGSLADLARALWGLVRWALGVARRVLGAGGDAAGLAGRLTRLWLRVGRWCLRLFRRGVRARSAVGG